MRLSNILCALALLSAGGLLLTEQDFDRAEIVPVFERPLDDALWDELNTCSSAYMAGECGSYWPWILHENSYMTQSLRGVAGATKLAILNGRDVSGNDFTTKLATYRAAPTRIFGGSVTYGAFGPVASLPAYFHEVMGGSMQLWDSIFVQTPGDLKRGNNKG